MGGDVVIAVNLNDDRVGRHFFVHASEEKVLDEHSEKERKESPDPGLFDVIAGALGIMQDRITRSRMAGEPPDILITPQVGNIALMDFDRASESIAAGRTATRREQAELRKLSRAL